ncbi:MAG: EAL domain-containing protein [Alphaproteobacteria bacterium]|nr:EAL domain-containing protein [Alphaproteobacteria bacterium]
MRDSKAYPRPSLENTPRRRSNSPSDLPASTRESSDSRAPDQSPPLTRRSLSVQQAIRAIGVAFTVGLIIGLFDAYTQVEQQRKTFAQTVQNIVSLSRVGASDAISKLDVKLAEQVSDEIIALEPVVLVEILFPNGDVYVARSKSPPEAGSLANRLGESVFSASASGRVTLFDTWNSGGSDGPAAVGELHIELDRVMAGSQLLTMLFIRIAEGVLQAVVIGLILALLFHRFLSRPLRELGQEIDRIDLNAPDADPIAVPAGHEEDEIGTLANRINRMMSKISEGQRALRRLSTRDDLTNLPNRLLIHEMLEQALARADAHNGVVAVLFLDLDRFKQVNDTLGYDSGDQLLRAVGKRIQSCLRGDETLGRLSGDEFLIIVENLDGFEQAASVSRRLERTLASSFRIDGHSLHVTASIGISLFPTDSITPKELLNQADVAMYNAKAQGGGFQFFSNEMSERAQVRLKIETSLRLALERQEFELFYQPKISLDTGDLKGCEALIRWRHEGEFISPDRFIPIAEQTALILPIGEWVLSEACRVIAKWDREGYSVPMSVNVSARQIVPGSFVQYVRACIDAHGIRPELLELEITETAVIQRLEEFRDIIAELRLMGIGIAIDDFGTGYSSLAYVRDIDATTLKIDRHFIKDLPEDGTLVSVILNLARELRIDVVAEGVENQEQVDWLKRHGCAMAQGHLFNRAVTEHQFQRQYLSSAQEDVPASRSFGEAP